MKADVSNLSLAQSLCGVVCRVENVLAWKIKKNVYCLALGILKLILNKIINLALFVQEFGTLLSLKPGNTGGLDLEGEGGL